jgi:hypothetical protein
MNYDEMLTVWNSPANTLTEQEQRRLVARLLGKIRQQRWHRIGMLAWQGLMLGALTAFTAWLILGTDRVRIGSEWSVLPLLLALWTAFAFLALRSRCPAARGDVSILEALHSTRAALLARRRGLGVAMATMAVLIPLLALNLVQLSTAGKLAPRELVCFSAFAGIAMLASLAAMQARRLHLARREMQLVAVVTQLESTE